MQHRVPKVPTDAEGLLRLKDIIGDRTARPPTRGLLPIAASTWWELVRAGEAPKPLKIGRASLWRARDVHQLIERLDRDGAIMLPRRELPSAAWPATRCARLTCASRQAGISSAASTGTLQLSMR